MSSSRQCTGCNSTETPSSPWVPFIKGIYCQPCIEDIYVQQAVEEQRHPPASDGWCPECDLYTVVLPNICSKCQEKHERVCTCDGRGQCNGCALRLDDETEYAIWCEPESENFPTKCTCDGSGRMCPQCCEEDSDPCRGCGSHSLWDNRYCRACYDVRYGQDTPMCVDCGGHGLAQGSARCYACIDGATRSPDELRELIEEIEARLLTNLTKGQRDDWVWILQNRRADLAAAEKEMWEGYDRENQRGY